MAQSRADGRIIYIGDTALKKVVGTPESGKIPAIFYYFNQKIHVLYRHKYLQKWIKNSFKLHLKITT